MFPRKDALSWKTSHLSPLNKPEADSALLLMRAWHEKKPWSPLAGSEHKRLWEHTERHGLGGMVGALGTLGIVPDAPELVQWGTKRYHSNMLHYEQSLRICRELDGLCKELEMPYVIMKGPALTGCSYTDSGIRDYADIDIFMPSYDDALKVARKLNTEGTFDTRALGAKKRFFEPGRIHTMYRQWDLEFCVPAEAEVDPMGELINRNPDAMYSQREFLNGDFWVPKPDFHFTFLITHMTKHMCSRLIWFSDLAAFCKLRGDEIDFNWVSKELEHLQILDMSSAITGFCNKHISDKVPVLRQKRSGWNIRAQNLMTSPGQILKGHFNFYHQGLWRNIYLALLIGARYFIITDSSTHSFFRNSFATRWSTLRVMFTIGKYKGILFNIGEAITRVLAYPVIVIFVTLGVWGRDRQ